MNYISKLPQTQESLGGQLNRKKIVLMGSTGTIGRNTLAIIRNTQNLFEIYALAGGKNIDLLAKQANEFRPPLLGIQEEKDISALTKQLSSDYKPQIVFGKKGYAFLASLPEIDTVVSAQVGAAGLRATVAATEAGKNICLANKESLVLAGDLIRYLAQKNNSTILPVDSEHYAIFQCILAQYTHDISCQSNLLQNKQAPNSICNSAPASAPILSPTLNNFDDLPSQNSYIKKLILTASGGPFRGKDTAFLKNVTVQDALKHPNWNMGAKISIDSASLMNKGLEVIEACHLYGVPLEKIDVLVHPQSIVHSLVEWQDGSILAQLASPDMRLPIGACLAYPQMLDTKRNTLSALDLTKQALNFEEANLHNFPCLRLAREAFTNNACVELNAANEIAVDLFLQEKIPFTEIPTMVDRVLQKSSKNSNFDFKSISTEDALLHIEERDRSAREIAISF